MQTERKLLLEFFPLGFISSRIAGPFQLSDLPGLSLDFGECLRKSSKQGPQEVTVAEIGASNPGKDADNLVHGVVCRARQKKFTLDVGCLSIFDLRHSCPFFSPRP